MRFLRASYAVSQSSSLFRWTSTLRTASKRTLISSTTFFFKPDTYNLYGLGLSNPLSPFFLFILKSSTRRTLLSDRQQHHPRSMGPSSRRLPPLLRAHLRSGSAPPDSSIFGRPPQRGYPPSGIQPARGASRRRHTRPSHTDTASGAPLACFPREGRS